MRFGNLRCARRKLRSAGITAFARPSFLSRSRRVKILGGWRRSGSTSEEMLFRHYRKWIPGLQVRWTKNRNSSPGRFRVLLEANCPPRRPKEDPFARKSSQIKCLAWRRGGDSNPRSHKGSRDFESRRLNQTPEPLRNRSAFTFAYTQSRKSIREKT
jgi:hypothetical protein